MTGVVEQAARGLLGQANILTGWRHPFSDDFGLFMAAAPGCLMLLGTANPDKGITVLWHRPGFDIDELDRGRWVKLERLRGQNASS